ncbi:MAG: extracellular solute-binding protein [Gammaproteobacteria bacterium]|nr:extracellular solute-binding protein [Gammaproteobacteria bacterium]
MKSKVTKLAGLLLGVAAVTSLQVQAETLRLLTWGGYAPQEVIELFQQETGIEVKVTKSNNEDMISKLRATGGAGFDLAQPSQDRISSAQAEFNIYRPIDLARIKSDLFIPSMLEATVKNTSIGDKVYGVPHVWGTSGLVVNRKAAPDVRDYTDLCDDALAGRVSYRLKRPTLIAFAFALGEDPFAAYGDRAQYARILEKVSARLTECKPNVKKYWSGSDDLLNLIRSGEVVAAMAWDAGGWKLNKEDPDTTFVAPKSGALGWIDTFALPRKSKAEDAAYQWINFVMRPDIAAKITAESSYFTASKGASALVEKEQTRRFEESFPQAAIDNIKWYPPVPAGLEEMEGKVLDRIKAHR